MVLYFVPTLFAQNFDNSTPFERDIIKNIDYLHKVWYNILYSIFYYNVLTQSTQICFINDSGGLCILQV